MSKFEKYLLNMYQNFNPKDYKSYYIYKDSVDKKHALDKTLNDEQKHKLESMVESIIKYYTEQYFDFISYLAQSIKEFFADESLY